MLVKIPEAYALGVKHMPGHEPTDGCDVTDKRVRIQRKEDKKNGGPTVHLIYSSKLKVKKGLSNLIESQNHREAGKLGKRICSSVSHVNVVSPGLCEAKGGNLIVMAG